MALKGHTKIELTNVNTGEVEVYEDDNMVTNALGMFVEHTGCFNFNWFSMDSVLRTANPDLLTSRGLMLFSDPIDEDPTIVYPPPGNYMTGQASTQTYAGIQTTFGSYNINESAQLENGWRYVWDFNESQSNGRINCACLTSQHGGLMGAGSDIGPDDGHVGVMYQFSPADGRLNSSNSSSYVTVNQVATVNTTMHYGLMCCTYIDLENNCFYSFKEVPLIPGWSTNYNMFKYKRIILQKCRLPINNFSLFEYNVHNSQKVIETFTLDIPEDIVNEYSEFFNSYTNATGYAYPGCCINEFNKHIYIYIDTNTKYGQSITALPAGASFFILDIDVENKNISYFNMINTTGQAITLRCSSTGRLGQTVYTTDKYVFMHANDGKIYRISRENNSDVIKLTYHNGNDISLSEEMFWVEVGGKLYGTRGYVGSSYNTVYCIDPEGCTIQRMAVDARTFPGLVNISSGDNWQIVACPAIARMYGTKYGPLYAFISYAQNYATKYIYPFIFPNFLMTINNLPQEIIKSPEQTMKVIYTITNET